MARKALSLLIPATATLLVASQWADLRRYVKIRRLWVGQGHPEYVPVLGRRAYPQRPGAGTPDGTGDFDSASRGAPRGRES